MKLGQAVGAHQPYEVCVRKASAEERQRRDCMGAPEVLLEPGNDNAGIGCHGPAQRKPLAQRQQSGLGLERIAGCNEPPEAIKPELFQRSLTDRAMPGVWRIERAAQQADPLTRRRVRRTRPDRAEVGT